MKTIIKLETLVAAVAFAFLVFSCEKQEDVIVAPQEEIQVAEEQPVVENTDPYSTTTPTQLPETRLSLNWDQMKNISPGNDFTFRFFERVYKDERNLYDVQNMIMSPLSVQFVCGMVGNYIEDSRALCKMLGIEGDKIEGVNYYYKTLIEDLVKEDNNTKLTLANALMTDVRSVRFPSDFISAIKDYYQAEYLDFEAKTLTEQPRGERPEDLWVKEKTDGMINLAPFPLFNKEYSLFNTICFKGEWKYKFDVSCTTPLPFYVQDKNIGKVPMMNKNFVYPYYKNLYFRSVSIPIGDGSYFYTILLPNEGESIKTVLEELSSKSWDKLRNSLENKYIHLGVPKYTANFEHQELFSLLDKEFQDDFLDQIDNKAFKDPENTARFNKLSQRALFQINEDGATAAAVSQMILYTAPGDDNRIENFVADHPFVYTISEAGSGLVLFMGTYSGKGAKKTE